MEVKGFPTRVQRWCCEEYKESRSPRGAVMIFGVRAAESPRRKAAWKPVSLHRRTHAWVVSPILSWSDADVWEFIHAHNLPYCSLYDEGFKRLGCIGCPMAGAAGKRKQFDRWPRFEALWRRSFQRVWEKRTGTIQRDGRVWFGDVYFRNWEEMWQWWLTKDSLPQSLTGEVEQSRDLWEEMREAEEEAEEDSCQTALDMFSGGTEIKGD
jgi:phosphoadenosine phosphosulfate reductase